MRDIDKQLLLAAYYGHHRKLDKFIKDGANVSVECDCDLHYGITHHWTPMMCAASNGKIKCLQLLVEHGADVNQNNQSVHLATPFMAAAEYGHIDAMKWLIERGADMNARNHFKKTILMLVCDTGYKPTEKVIRFLLNNGVDLSLKDHLARTAPLIYLKNRQGFNKSVFQAMLDKGIDIQRRHAHYGSLEDVARQFYGDDMVQLMRQYLKSSQDNQVLLGQVQNNDFHPSSLAF